MLNAGAVVVGGAGALRGVALLIIRGDTGLTSICIITDLDFAPLEEEIMVRLCRTEDGPKSSYRLDFILSPREISRSCEAMSGIPRGGGRKEVIPHFFRCLFSFLVYRNRIRRKLCLRQLTFHENKIKLPAVPIVCTPIPSFPRVIKVAFTLRSVLGYHISVLACFRLLRGDDGMKLVIGGERKL